MLIDNYLSYAAAVLGRATRTCMEYGKELHYFARWLGADSGLREDDVLQLATRDDIQHYLADCSACGNSAATRARKISCLRSFYFFLVDQGLALFNQVAGMPRPKVPRKLPVYLSVNDAKKLITTARSQQDLFYRRRNALIVILLLNCGLRLSELTGIQLSDVYEDVILIKGKGSKERYVYLNKSCQRALRLWLHHRGDQQGALLVSKGKQQLSPAAVSSVVKHELRAAGLDVSKLSTHKLRHTCATLLYRYGRVDIRLLQSILGHSSIATTEIYTHVADEQLQAAMDSNPLADY
jgi:site-specific recombinase XerD